MKTLYTLLIALFSFAFSNAQIVDIPDANFKNALVNTICADVNGDGQVNSDVDTNDDGEIQVSEAEAVHTLYVFERDISSLSGIEFFINLFFLDCRVNNISELFLNQNTNLTYLEAEHNQLTNIDITGNPNLGLLDCSFNLLESIDISQNHNLIYCYLIDNQLNELNISEDHSISWLALDSNNFEHFDISQITSLTSLTIKSNNLNSLNVQNGNNLDLHTLNTFGNPNLYCIQVDDVEHSNNSVLWVKDEWTEYSEDCSLGIENNTFSNFTIYPNPTQDLLFIETQQHIETVKIYNLQGQLIKESSSNSMDVSNLNTGLYFAKIIVEGKSITRKFIKE